MTRLLTEAEVQAIRDHPFDHDVEWPGLVPGIDGTSVSIALSYTKLQAFKQCPRKYSEQYLSKRYPFSESTATQWGKQVHEAAYNYVFMDRPFPKHIAQRISTQGPDAIIQKFEALKAEGKIKIGLFGEQKWAMTANGKFSAYFAKTGVFLRGQADVGFGTHNTLVVADYKTGKGSRPDPSQIDAMAVLAAAQPNLEGYTKAQGWLLFLEAHKVVPRVVPELVTPMQAMQETALDILGMYHRDCWPEVETPLCGWCDVADCPMNRRS